MPLLWLLLALLCLYGLYRIFSDIPIELAVKGKVFRIAESDVGIIHNVPREHRLHKKRIQNGERDKQP